MSERLVRLFIFIGTLIVCGIWINTMLGDRALEELPKERVVAALVGSCLISFISFRITSGILENKD